MSPVKGNFKTKYENQKFLHLAVKFLFTQLPLIHLQTLRNEAMKTKHMQRYYEYKKGKRDFDSVWIPVPKAHAFQDPAANPRYNE